MIKDYSSTISGLENLRTRLLDLTLRNQLVNFRHSKTNSLRIVDELPNKLIEYLLNDKEMQFKAIPEPLPGQLIKQKYIKIEKETGKQIKLQNKPTATKWAKHLGFDTSFEVPSDSVESIEKKHADRLIQTLLFSHELETRLKKLRQKAETVIEEAGTNILYIAFGFLEWFENNDIEEPRLAPLFLLPVRLNKGKLDKETHTFSYTLQYSGEDIYSNLSLREKLKKDFGLALPELDENTQPEAYFNLVLDLIKTNKPTWCLRRFITLTLLNFSKLLMYLDLDPQRWPEKNSITEHPIISMFFGSQNIHEIPLANRNGDEYSIDDIANIHSDFPLIDDADSSQHSALIDVVKGKNIVIEGPPGTGKSQTITNLIAACMASGKRVLFVAEKQAALEVVKRRLDKAGLGSFCLELHSHKSQKSRILDEVDKRIKSINHFRKPSDIDADIERYEELKSKLKEYVELINQPWKNTNKTIHEIFAKATRFRQLLSKNPQQFHPEGYNGDIFTPVAQRQCEGQIAVYSDVCGIFKDYFKTNLSIQNHPWFGVQNTNLQIFDFDRIGSFLTKWQRYLIKIYSLKTPISKFFNCETDKIPTTIIEYKKFADDLQKIPFLEGNELLDLLPRLNKENIFEVEKYLELFENIHKKLGTLTDLIKGNLVGDPTIGNRITKAMAQLCILKDSSLKFDDISQLSKRMKHLLNYAKPIEEIIQNIQNALSNDANFYLNLSMNGLTELKTFIDILSSLKIEYWNLRDEIFENDELDIVLPKIKKDLESLCDLYNELNEYYVMNRLPEQCDLIDLRSTFQTAGILKWLKPKWRFARKKLLNYSSNPKNKYNTLIDHLGDAIYFADVLSNFTENKEYHKLLGTKIKGLETDLDSIVELRAWYKLVRKTYGVGFGPKVVLGNEIISLPSEIAKAIHILHQQGIKEKIELIQNEIKYLCGIFVADSNIQNNDTSLFGENGIITLLIKSMEQGVYEANNTFFGKLITISEASSLAQTVMVLQKDISVWQELHFVERYLDGKLNLSLNDTSGRQTSLIIAKNTIHFVRYFQSLKPDSIIISKVNSIPNAKIIDQLRSIGEKIQSLLESQAKSFSHFKGIASLNENYWFNQSDNKIINIIKRNNAALSKQQDLQHWLDYIREQQRCSELGFKSIVEAVENNKLPFPKILTAFYAGMYDKIAREIFEEIPSFMRFSGQSHASIRNQFKEYDIKLIGLQCENIAWKLDQIQVPPGNIGGRVGEYTELFLIRNECGKKRRQLPVRKLIERAGQALIALKPCFMMSPMSVAQYLSPGNLNFDVIVMDEASQIKPEDALGAIARGSQLVIVGDPKQLPPTSFFDRIGYDEDEDDMSVLEDSESILDAAMPIFPLRRLRWHYRSQHQSLIAFSNHFFYDNDLMIFPAPYEKTDEYGIRYKRVQNGIFVNRKNIEEAKIVALAARTHLLNKSQETLGIVAMSSEQRNILEAAIESLAKKDPLFQIALEKDQQKSESLFVKNLENVQGDERDIIFISMTYGPEEPGGRVFQRFGPINSNTGWRRLNVLFTRSRKRMHVFSSMGSQDILNTGYGVKAMRDFLAYSETGILHGLNDKTNRSPDSDFEISVAQALKKEGFDCTPQVGIAGFYIDIAVKDPGNPSRFLIGIECDGATYHSAKSVRDRDRLRQDILERLGWQIRRIWSTDWFKNPHLALKLIINELHELKTSPSMRPEKFTVVT
jgi:very-short-patch-repair endonuclease